MKISKSFLLGLSLVLMSSSALAQVVQPRPKLEFEAVFENFENGGREFLTLEKNPAELKKRITVETLRKNFSPGVVLSSSLKLLQDLPTNPDFNDLIEKQSIRKIAMFVRHSQGFTVIGSAYMDLAELTVTDSDGDKASCTTFISMNQSLQSESLSEWKEHFSSQMVDFRLNGCQRDIVGKLKAAKDTRKEAEAALARQLAERKAKEAAAALEVNAGLELINSISKSVDSLATARVQKDLKPASDSASAAKAAAPVTQPE